MSEISATRPTSFCNFNCICTKCDCTFKHYIESLDERRFANNIYSKVKNIKEHVQEDNRETRRANCHYGQLCSREDCGFRHFLDWDGRKKFIAAFNAAKSTTIQSQPSFRHPSAAPISAAASSAPPTTSSEVVVLRNTVSTLQNKVKDLESIITALQATNLELENKVESQVHIIAKLSKEDSPSKFASAGSRTWADLMAEEDE
jgi:hypothetical protein